MKTLLLLLVSLSAFAQTLSITSATLNPEANGWNDKGVAVTVTAGSGTYSISSGTCFNWIANQTSGIAVGQTVYISFYAPASPPAIGSSDTCVVQIGATNFTATLNYKQSQWPPLYATNMFKIANSALTGCAKNSAVSFYRAQCATVNPRPGGTMAGWPTAIGQTWTDPLLGGVFTQIGPAGLTIPYETNQEQTVDNKFLWLFQLTNGNTGYVYDMNGNLKFTATGGGFTDIGVNAQSAQWRANPSFPLDMLAYTATTITKFTLNDATNPTGWTVAGGSLVFTDTDGIHTGVSHRASNDDWVGYIADLNSQLKICAVNIVSLKKLCYDALANSMPDNNCPYWKAVSITPRPDKYGDHYLFLAHGPCTNNSGDYMRYLRFNPVTDTTITYLGGIGVSYNNPAGSGLAFSRWDNVCNPSLSQYTCSNAAHQDWGMVNGDAISNTADPIQQFPVYRTGRVNIRMSRTGTDATLKASIGGGLKHAGSPTEYGSCASLAPLCLLAGGAHNGAGPMAASLIDSITGSSPYTVVTHQDGVDPARDNPHGFIVGDAILTNNVTGCTGVNGTGVVSAVVDAYTYRVNVAVTGTCNANTGTVVKNVKWQFEDDDANTLEVIRLDTGQVRQYGKPYVIPFRSCRFDPRACSYWNDTRGSISSDGTQFVFNSNGGVIDGDALFKGLTNFNVDFNTKSWQFDKLGNGFYLSMTHNTAFAYVLTGTNTPLSCRLEIADNGDMTTPLTQTKTIAGSGWMSVGGVASDIQTYDRIVCNEDLVAVNRLRTLATLSGSSQFTAKILGTSGAATARVRWGTATGVYGTTTSTVPCVNGSACVNQFTATKGTVYYVIDILDGGASVIKTTPELTVGLTH